MDERNFEKNLKRIVILLAAIFLVYLCLPYENGNSEGAVLRNYIRREKALPWNVGILHLEDVTLQEQMRAAIFVEKEDYVIQWYQMDEDGNYKLYKNAHSQLHNDDENVIRFSQLHIDGYEQEYEVYFVEDKQVEQLHLFYAYKLREGKEVLEEGNIEKIYPVKNAPQLLCVQDVFAELLEKGGNGIGGSIEAVAEDEEGNKIFDQK